MNDEVKEAASRRERWKMYPSHVKPFAIHEYCQTSGNRGGEIADLVTLADAYLAELEETPISGDLLIPLGFTYWQGTWSIGLSDTSELYWVSPSGEDSWNGVRGLFILASDPTDRPEGFSHIPTPYMMGQVRTLLRVFGVDGGEKK